MLCLFNTTETVGGTAQSISLTTNRKEDDKSEDKNKKMK